MNFDQALAYLYELGHEMIVIKLGLTNTIRLLEELGQPHHAYRKVQIAGTNGKGSTAAFLESICRAAGWRTGLNTSPHLVEVTERIRLNGNDLSREEFARLTVETRRAADKLRAEGLQPSFFEHLTVMALLAFRQAGLDMAVLETGLGGRLDATTAAGAEIAGITPIDLDHTRILGDTRAAIAAEKAAIIHPQTFAAISAPQLPEVRAVIDARAAECGVKMQYVADELEVTGATTNGRMKLHLTTPRQRYEDLTLALRGRHQIVNAALAVALAEALDPTGRHVTPETVREGLATARHAGRLERHAGRPALLYDGAHNVSGAAVLRDYLQEFVRVPLTIVFGAMRDKDATAISGLLFPLAERVIITQPDQPRAALPEALAAAVAPELRDKITLQPDVAQALQEARNITPDNGIILVTGSLYLVGAALSQVQK